MNKMFTSDAKSEVTRNLNPHHAATQTTNSVLQYRLAVANEMAALGYVWIRKFVRVLTATKTMWQNSDNEERAAIPSRCRD